MQRSRGTKWPVLPRPVKQAEECQVNGMKNTKSVNVSTGVIGDSILPVIRVKRVDCWNRRLMKELVCLQDSIFQCLRHNRFSELMDIAACAETSAMFLALHGRRISGFVVVRRSARHPEWHVRGIGVDRPYRRTGTGTLLLLEAVRFVNEIKGEGLVSYVDRKNTPSLRLHGKTGFRIDTRFCPAATELRWRLIFP